MANVQLPDGSVVAFPAGMADSDINAAIEQHLSPAAAPEMPWYENYANAAVKSPIKAVTGVMQLANDVGEALPGGSTEQGDASRAFTKKFLADIDKKYPTQPGFSRWLGDTIADPRNAIMAAAKGPVMAGALMGGSMGLTNPDPEDEGLGGRAAQGAFGAAAGAASGKLTGALLGPSENKLEPEQQRLAKTLLDNGVDLTPLQQTGNPAYKAMEGTFKSLPVTSSIQEKVGDSQLKQFTAAVLDKAGVNADAATPDIISKGYHNAGNMIGQITEKYAMPIDNQFTQEVMDIQNQYGHVIAPSERPQFEEWVNKLTDPKLSTLPGKVYQDTRSNLGKIAQSAWKRDPNFATAIDSLQNAMDDSIARAMPADDVAALNQYRGFYGNMKTIMRAQNTGQPDALVGNVLPSRLGNALRTGNDTRYTQGLGPLNNLSRAAELILKEPAGSASKPSWKIPEAIGGAVAGGGAIHGESLASGIAPGIVSGAMSIGGPAAVQQIYNRAPSYMVNGLPGLNSKSTQRLIAAMLAKQAAEGLPQ